MQSLSFLSGLSLALLLPSMLAMPQYAPHAHVADEGEYRHVHDDYDDTPAAAPCPQYPYCNEAPYNIDYLQDEINLLRQRNALIVQHGERQVEQEPNRPFVGGYQHPIQQTQGYHI